MSAVLYIKSTSMTLNSTTALLIAKTKVAPLKRWSIPRLELGAAVISSKLARHVLDTAQFTISSVHMWTDAKVALTWIHSHPSRWKDFVSNRVALIQDLLPSATWRHVPGLENPADCASRGLTTAQFAEHPLWWHGPPWLLEDVSQWPAQTQSLDVQELPEMRPSVSLTAAKAPSPQWDLLLNYSSLPRLLRITGWCIIACKKFKSRVKSNISTALTPDIITQAKLIWVKQIQQEYFAEDIRLLQTSKLANSHIFSKLTAFVDPNGILRVGGRLSHSHLSFTAQHPAILPRSSALTTLIIRHAHHITLHGGTQVTLAHIRTEYWIIGGRAPVKSHILQCVTCSRFRAHRAQQLMGQLPMPRVTPTRPFTHTGIDYAGPLTIKSWKGRGSKTYKSWICIFVCFSSSAVHIESVSDYSTEQFIAAYQRFAARRGVPLILYSDQGTNFIGADKELRTWYRQAQNEDSSLYRYFSTTGTHWKFNPPAAPHMGGKWEAAVKSIKYHLRRTVKDISLTFEETQTLLAQIEAVLNSRPLEPLSEDPDDVEALTPGHFLIGQAINTIPQPSLLHLDESRLSRWQLIQQRIQHFWKLWSRQYLNHQQAISKWHHPTHNIQVGSLVLITDERSPPTKWPLARVIKLHPGKDNLTRVVTLKTETTELTRPIAKLAILPVPVGTSINQPGG